MDPLSIVLIIGAVIILVIAIALLVFKPKSSDDEKKSSSHVEDESEDAADAEVITVKEEGSMTEEEAIEYVRKLDADAKAAKEARIAEIKAIVAETLADSKKIEGLTPEQIETARIINEKREKDAKAEKEALVAVINEILSKIHDKPYNDLFAKILADVKAARSKEEFDAAVARFNAAVEDLSKE